MEPLSPASAPRGVRRHALRRGDCAFELLIELAADTQELVPSASIRISVGDLERVFANAEVQVAVVAGSELRYLYVNAAYRAIRPEVPMVGRTYRDVFPEAADAGAEARLRSVIRTSESWIVEDYPTWLPNRPVPAWWQGECVPIDVTGRGHADAALILIWEVTQRHIPDWGPPPPSDARLRIDAAKAKLAARMAEHGLDLADGWSISEEVREADDATLWILRPMHLRQSAPAWLTEQVAFTRSRG
jgi:hypothetical protein